MKRLFVIAVAAAGLLVGADLNGSWNLVWQTPGGERRSTLSFTQTAEKVDPFPEGKEPITGNFRGESSRLPGACTRLRLASS